MVIFTIKCDNIKVPFIVLNGINFHYRLQSIFLGKDKDRNYFTSNFDIDDIEVIINNIDVNKEDINQYLMAAYADSSMLHSFKPIKQEVIEENYNRISIKPSFDFFLNLRDYFGSDLEKIIQLYLFHNVSLNWLAAFFSKYSRDDIIFLLDYLPIYIEYIDMRGMKWHTYLE